MNSNIISKIKGLFMPEESPDGVEHLLTTEGIKDVLDTFIADELPYADGIIIMWSRGKHVGINSAGFTDDEAILWMDKAKFKLHCRGLTFRD